METIRQGPERLDEFDEELFAALVERITATSTGLRLRLNGGIELDEQLGEGRK